ncbi:Hypothetical predicted protein [Paramuricea clavata]|uniref:Uncharacterized protein n=1 Tax=Paramuricea clavata TaxID=317549 RepID=A0A6S7JM24_PARCT|nr:Hypothetical predicted protein [Paramuricea clavata]
MEDASLLLLYYKYQRMRDSARRRSLARRRRRLFLLLQRNNQNMMFFQYVRTISLAMMMIARMVGQINQRQYWEIPRPRLGWFEVIFGDDCQAGYWKEHFRMRKETFLRLVDFVTPEIAKEDTIFRDAIPPHKRVAIALWRLAVGSSFRAIAAHFDVGKSTCVKITKEFCQALNKLSRHYIKFPTSCDETTRALALFQDDCKFPHAVGSIDGTHIEIIAPEEPFDYFDRHHRYSVILQGVVGKNLTFLDTAIGYPGSMHDARVLRSSDIFQKAQNGDILTEPLASINGVQVRPLLLGDGAYPLLPWLIKPYPNGAILNCSQRRFNKTLSSARSIVERAFGILKARWRILLKRLDNRFENISEVILSCCILHNFCQEAGEEFDDEEILRRIISIDREYLETRRQENIV